mmetsp:Transcript_104045/g.189968  ORF Transcript_104045/g.189968 Transcript_104045/m.189968 type:complete len:105 (-) Transcript_104045:50-364(-)
MPVLRRACTCQWRKQPLRQISCASAMSKLEQAFDLPSAQRTRNWHQARNVLCKRLRSLWLLLAASQIRMFADIVISDRQRVKKRCRRTAVLKGATFKERWRRVS